MNIEKTIQTTDVFDRFAANLKDLVGRARIQARIRRLAEGNPGDHRNLKKGVTEMRIDFGPGYRVYYTERDKGTIVILLVGGDKASQQRDIDLAYDLVDQL
ncbi:type II toxin-antitoxin system RelE/ParE family toxin [Bordetella petrii]|uniref:type II toxin-antitoxin system RelE/ParE family toxin n=1 Tax=Bordetella petrii TaxID=94624 RepID=UPI001E40002E|nr:type II toxin-antitoxin system RelE/ParE family toxin [Bordetella petrii]MCD0503297.1 type II toxin-antitoxin system RelE/ParE family toxin [Bordetella petrii]